MTSAANSRITVPDTAVPVADLQARGLTKSFTLAGGKLDVLRGADLELRRGEAAVIMGPSGSGKSTLLYLLGTLDTPTAGTMHLLGVNPFELAPPALAQFRNERIGFVFQDHILLPQCSVLENVLLPALPGGGAGPEAVARGEQLLARVGLQDRMRHRPAEISGGERQRAALCRALMNRPALLLADEPTGNLDQETASRVGTLLLEIAREEQTVLVTVTHSRELAARFPTTFELHAGRLERRT